jgi:hypothetical protein
MTNWTVIDHDNDNEQPADSRADAVEYRYDPLRGPRQRVVFEPRSDDRWTRIHYRWGGCQWQFVGSQIVDDVEVERGQEVI